MSELVEKRDKSPRATLLTCGAAHILHDGYANLIYLFLPVWAAEFQLTLTQVGLLRAGYAGALGIFQLPAGLLSERAGERGLLGIGTALMGLGFLALGFAGGFLTLLALLVLAGFGSCVQHPLASSLVSRVYEAGGRRAALGIYNFAGDVGKVALPGLMGLALVAITWRQGTAVCGILALLCALSIVLALGRLGEGQRPANDGNGPAETASRGWGIKDRRGFKVLSAIGIIDNATRTAALTFVPFLLMSKGASVQEVGLALSLILGGGAFGKFICGMVAQRFGIIRTVIVTEAATAAGIGILLALPLGPAFAFLPLFGLALNGTSTVLYGTVAELAEPERHSRAFGLFYTLTTGASAVAPAVYGVISDFAGVPATLSIAAVIVLITIPLARLLRV